MTEQAYRIPSLDGLRAISIFLVVVSHLLYTKDFLMIKGIVRMWFPHLGALGVRTFFVISGFLITSLLLRELEDKRSIHLTKFYFRRTFRIFPAYYFFLSVVITFYLIGWLSLIPGDITHALTYTINYHPERSWSIAHGWSLSVEEQFYLIWPTTLMLLGKRRSLWIAGLLLILCPVIRLGYFDFFPDLVKYELDYRFETVVDSIAIGCLLAGIHEWLKLQRVYQIILNSKLFILVPIIVFYVNSLNERSRLALLFYVTVQNVGIAACMVWCITNCAGKIGTILNSKAMVYIGKMSYSIYLWQQPFFPNRDSSSMLLHFPFNLLLIGVVAPLAYHFIERPAFKMRDWLENKLFAYRKGTAQDPTGLRADGNISASSAICKDQSL